MDRCPKCGDDSGYMFRATEVHVYTGGWGEEAHDVDVDYDRTRFPKTVKCDNCGARVPIGAAEGTERKLTGESER